MGRTRSKNIFKWCKVRNVDVRAHGPFLEGEKLSVSRAYKEGWPEVSLGR